MTDEFCEQGLGIAPDGFEQAFFEVTACEEWQIPIYQPRFLSLRPQPDEDAWVFYVQIAKTVSAHLRMTRCSWAMSSSFATQSDCASFQAVVVDEFLQVCPVTQKRRGKSSLGHFGVQDLRPDSQIRYDLREARFPHGAVPRAAFGGRFAKPLGGELPPC